MLQKTTLPTINSWDIIANDYNNIITEFDIEIANFLIRKLKKYNIPDSKPILELGCGSGHISFLLAKSNYQVDLLDFSKIALKKANTLFEKNSIKARFINSNIFKLNKIEKYDTTWNSGVMEHFDNDDLLKALISIYKTTNNLFIFFVPNPKSFFYIYYRFLMIQAKRWNVGFEFLRTNYKKYINKSGFKVLETGFIGKSYSKNQIEFCFPKNKLLIDQLKYMLDKQMFRKDQYYLKYYICQK